MILSQKSLLAILLCSLVLIEAHTWIQCTDYRPDGTCAGFIRNYRGRNPPGTDSTDDFYTNKLLGQDPNFTVCKSDTQAAVTYTAQFPKAVARAGSTLKTMYTPNGHSDPGDVGETTFARIHWNRGTNGPSGQLRFRRDLNASNELSRTNYAVNCQTTGDFASLPCVNPFTIPRDTPPGTYQFVWYWPYNKNPNQRPFGEEYYSCFEIDVIAADAALPTSATSATRTSTSAPRTSTSAPRTSTSAPRTSTSTSAPRTSTSSSATRTSASTSATRSSSSRAASTSEQTSSSEQQESSESNTNSETSTGNLEDVASHSNKFIGVGLFSLIFLI